MSRLLALPKVGFGKDEAKPPRHDPGLVGKLEWIAPSRLRIDANYQRDIGNLGVKNIRRIARQFAWRKFSPLIVAERAGGVYAIIDGQHRAIAATLKGGIEKLPCLIIRCSEAEEADSFSTINAQITRVHSQALFRARLAAGNSLAVSAQKSATAAGVKILAYPLAVNKMAPGETLACGAIELACEHYGFKITTAALRGLAIGANGRPGLIRAALIRATCKVLFENPDWTVRENEVGAALAAYGLDKLMRKAAELSTIGDHKRAHERMVPLIVQAVSKYLDRA